MTGNKVVVRYQDGRILKGFTSDFLPGKDRFHVQPLAAPPQAQPVEVSVPNLKGLFFVKDFDGSPEYKEQKDFLPSQRVMGRKLRVLFKDGEEMTGTTQGYQPGRPGFFVIPADPQSNNMRCFVVAQATQQVSFV